MVNSSGASVHPDLFGARPSARDVYELLRLPALIAVVTAAVTWLIWYYTSTSCTPELASLVGCNPATIAKYINVDIYGRILTYSAITGAVGGVWNYDMFTKMRAAIAAEQARADEAVQQLTEYRQQSEAQLADYRQQAEEERRLREEERRQEREAFMAALAEERQRSEEERRQMQQQATESQQAFMAALTEITAQIAQQRNGSNGDAPNGA